MGVREVNSTEPMKQAVFFDRDGVLNHAIVREGKPYPPKDLSEFRIMEHAREDLLRLKSLGFVLVVVTNQPDIARGTANRSSVDEMNNVLNRELPLDDILVCPHDSGDRCACRKPSPGLLHNAAGRFGIDLQKSFLIGDRWRDIDAGHAAGCTTVMIDYGYQEQHPAKEPALRAHSLSEAVSFIANHNAARVAKN
jgi:D-glycero-D-manno-heptose 1,7-bisphosphate phosphatase